MCFSSDYFIFFPPKSQTEDSELEMSGNISADRNCCAKCPSFLDRNHKHAVPVWQWGKQGSTGYGKQPYSKTNMGALRQAGSCQLSFSL